MYGTIYLITNTVNDKVYVGQTISPLRVRWVNHKSFAKKDYYNSPSKLARSMRKHGVEKFSIKSIATAVDKVTLDWLEQHYIDLFDSIANGYNLRNGGANGPASESTKQLMSESQKRIGNKPPAATQESQAKAAATRREKFAGKPRQWNVGRDRALFANGFIYPNAVIAAADLGIPVSTLRSYLKRSRKPRFECEWLCSASDPSVSQTETH